MGIRAQCPACDRSLVVHDRFASRQIRCPDCETPFAVPKVSAPVAIEQEEPQDIENEVDAADLVQAHQIESSPVSFPVITAEDVYETHGSAASEPWNEEFHEDQPESSGHRRSLKHDEEEEEDIEWDITPMVDVAFLLLIFFMLTASFSIQKAIPTTAAQSDEPSSNAQSETSEQLDNFTIQIDEFNGYTVISTDGETQVASGRQDLIMILRDLRTELGEEASPRVVIQAHMDSMHGAVVACMDAARESQFVKFKVLAVEEFD
jgi:biopolymer transport protein ExbD